MTNSDVKPDWRVLKLEQKAYLNAEFAAEKQVKTCGVFYLVDANLHVHICSLTPNLEAWPIQGYATFETEEAAEQDEGELERELLDTEEGCSYLGTEVLATCQHEAATEHFDLPAQDEGETDENYRKRLAEVAYEECCANPVWF